MSTRYPDVFAALAAPFDNQEVKSRQGAGGRQLHYITARTAMNRLDNVLGPEDWQAEFAETRDGIKCRLSIRLEPGGEWLAKEDGGGFADMAAEDDTEKSGYSDAFKRAAVHWGVGRYLYRDGVPDFGGPAAGAAPAPSRPATTAAKASPARTWDELLDRAIRRWHKFDPIPDARERTAREHRVAHHLVTAAIADDLVDEERVLQPVAAGHEPARAPAKVWACVRWLWDQHPDWVRRACREYLAEKESQAQAQSEALAN